MIGALIPHFSPAYYDQLFVELFRDGNFRIVFVPQSINTRVESLRLPTLVS